MGITKRAFWYEKIGLLPLQQPAKVRPDRPVRDVITKMQNSRYGCVFVVDDADSLIGIFTDRDVMEHFVASSLPGDVVIEQIMTKNPITISADDTVEHAVELFHEKKVRHLPVADKRGAVKGLLSVRVLVDFIAEYMPAEVLNLPPDRSIVSKETAGG